MLSLQEGRSGRGVHTGYIGNGNLEIALAAVGGTVVARVTQALGSLLTRDP